MTNDKDKKDRLPLALLILTLVTGLVDAVSVLALGQVFTANMTGNVVFLAFAAAGAPGFSVARSLTSLVAFLAGAVLGGCLIVRMVGSTLRRGWLLIAAGSEAILLFVAAWVSIGVSPESAASTRLYAIIALTAVAMGLRNATVRQLAVPDLTTTVLTLTLTALAADSSLAGGRNPRLGRRVASVLTMFAGAAAGALLLRFGIAVPLLLSGICVLLAAALYATTSPPASGDTLTATRSTPH
ncbi:MAG: YoaK family protein [Candidatus Acidiferrales bacterium]